MIKLGISSIGFEHTTEKFAELRESGLCAVEVAKHGMTSNVDFKKIAQYAKENDVTLWSCHLPYDPFKIMDISLPDKETRRQCFAELCKTIDEAADLGIDKFVLHPSCPLPEDEDRNEYKMRAMEMLDKLAEYAQKAGGVIAVEDMIVSCLGNSAAELNEMISVNDKLRVCFDVNHLFNDTHEHFFDVLGDKIITAHISDYDFVQERHWFPGHGKIDWPKLYSTFEKHNFNGVWNFEFGLKNSGINYIGRPATFKDLYDITEQMSHGKAPVIK